jgi:hypothetical protein
MNSRGKARTDLRQWHHHHCNNYSYNCVDSQGSIFVSATAPFLQQIRGRIRVLITHGPLSIEMDTLIRSNFWFRFGGIVDERAFVLRFRLKNDVFRTHSGTECGGKPRPSPAEEIKGF